MRDDGRATASERHLRALIETASLMVYECTTEGEITLVNSAAEKATGYSREELVGTHVWDRLEPGPKRDGFPDYLRRLVAERPEPTPLFSRSRRKDGRWIDIRVDWNYLRDENGRVTGFVCLVSDITDLVRTEHDLKEQQQHLEDLVRERTATLEALNKQLKDEVEERRQAEQELVIFKLFAENAVQGFGMAELDTTIKYCNPIGLGFFGVHKPEGFIDTSFLDYYPDPFRRQLEKEIVPTILQEGKWTGEVTFFTPEGEKREAIFNLFLVRDESEKPIRIALVVTDITQRKQAEEALRRERQTLRHMLRSSDHERRLIAYEIHDGIAQQLAAALMQFQSFKHLKDQGGSKAKTAFDAGMDMLQQSHAEARRLISGVRPPILDESGIVAALAHLVHDQLAETAGARIEFHSDVAFNRLAPTLENAIYRIAQEGLTNAVKHSRSERIRLSLVQNGDTVRLEVRDWGVGFDPETVSEDHFGLEGIQERTRLLDGRCVIESRPGKGADLCVDLPLLENG